MSQVCSSVLGPRLQGTGLCSSLVLALPLRAVVVDVQSLSHVRLCYPMDCNTPGFSVLHCLQSLLKLMSIESVMPSNHLIRCCPLLLLPSIFLSIRVFSNESALRIRWPKYWSFSFSISPSNSYGTLGRSCDHNPYSPSAGGSTFCPGVLLAFLKRATLHDCTACYLQQKGLLDY